MELVMNTEQNCLIITVCGEVDMYAAPDFYDAYNMYTQRYPVLPVILNIEKTTYMDSILKSWEVRLKLNRIYQEKTYCLN